MTDIDGVYVWQSAAQYKQIDPLQAGLLLYGLQLARQQLNTADDAVSAAIDDAEFQITSQVDIESETMKMCVLSNIVAPNTQGGSTVSGSWRDRVINGAEIGADFLLPITDPPYFSLTAGVYSIVGSQEFAGPANRIQTRLYNRTLAATQVVGNSTFGADGSKTAHIAGQFEITQECEFALQYRVFSSVATFGAGLAANMGIPEKYATLAIWRTP